MPSGLVSVSLVINVLFALDLAVSKGLPFVADDSTEALARALAVGVPALVLGAAVEAARLQRCAAAASRSAATVQAELDAQFVFFQGESEGGGGINVGSEGEGRLRLSQPNPAAAAAALAAEARVLADASAAEPSATIRILLASVGAGFRLKSGLAVAVFMKHV